MSLRIHRLKIICISFPLFFILEKRSNFAVLFPLRSLGTMLSMQHSYESPSVRPDGSGATATGGGGGGGARLTYSPFLQSLSLLALALGLDRAASAASGAAEEDLEWLVAYADSARAMEAMVAAGGGGSRGKKGELFLRNLMEKYALEIIY